MRSIVAWAIYNTSFLYNEPVASQLYSSTMSLTLNFSFIDLAFTAIVIFVLSFLAIKWRTSKKWKPLLSHGNYPPVTPLELDQGKRNQLLKRRKNYKLIELNLINRLIGIVIFSL